MKLIVFQKLVAQQEAVCNKTLQTYVPYKVIIYEHIFDCNYKILY